MRAAGAHPDPVAAALLAQQAGADGITAHLREDRRHIRDADMVRLKAEVALPLNFEMAATAEMQAIALAIQPNACLPSAGKNAKKRTTEGGLDVAGQETTLAAYIAPLRAAGIRISLFIDPDPKQVETAARIGANIVELHTGHYAELAANSAERKAELTRLQQAARQAAALGLGVHAGHGLTFANVEAIAAIPELVELNIGHFLIGEAVALGLPAAIREMRRRMDEVR